MDPANTDSERAVMEENRQRIPQARWQQTRRKLMQQMLDPLIESKLILVDALMAGCW